MIDHLLRFADESAAQADTIVGVYWNTNWRGDVCIPNANVYQVTGTQIITDPILGSTYSQDIRIAYPGWFLIISLPNLSHDFISLPNNALRLAANREANQIIYLAPDLDPASLATSKIEPLFAGSMYSI